MKLRLRFGWLVTILVLFTALLCGIGLGWKLAK
jgi:hypothetical protein